MKRLLLRDKRRDSKRLSCIIMLLVLLGEVTLVKAQRPMNDTIIGREPFYMYSNWPTDTVLPARVLHNDDRICRVALDWLSAYRPTAYISSLYTPNFGYLDYPLMGRWISGKEIQVDPNEPVMVMGVAAVAILDSSTRTGKPLPLGVYEPSDYHPRDCGDAPIVDATVAGRVTEYLQLYDLSDTVPQLVDEGPWRYEDTHRYMKLTTYVSNMGTHSVSYERVFEVYFGHDKGVVFDTNFMVAGTCFNNDRNFKGVYEYSFRYHVCCYNQWQHVRTLYPTLEIGPVTNLPMDTWWFMNDSVPWFRCPSELTRYDSIFYSTTGSTIGHYAMPLIFPILDTNYAPPCAEVSSVRVAAYDTANVGVTLMWDAGAHQREWEVAYGLATDDWTDYTHVTTTAPTVTLSGLVPEAQYSVVVRGDCGRDNLGPWSELYTFPAPEADTTGTGGGEGGEGGEGGDEGGDTTAVVPTTNLARFTQVLPNPAEDVVYVVSSYTLRHIDVYDLRGRKVLDQDAEGVTATFDVSDWPKGVYVVAIRTPQGLATKRLVVQ